MLRPRSPGAWVVLVLVAAATLAAQEAPTTSQEAPTTTISVVVKVVNVLATVRDSHGNIVNTLNREDFILEEDGRPQTIKYFTRETDLPLTLGLLVDTSVSQSQVLDQEKTASAVFTNEVLREGEDSAFLIHFDQQVELLQDLTSSRQRISAALRLLEMPRYDNRQRGGGYPGGGSRGSGYPGGGYPSGGSGGGWPGGGYPGGGYPGGGYPGGGSGGGYPGGRRGGSGRSPQGGGSGGGTLLYDSIFLASDELMQKQKGRKAIIVLTDGVDHGSKMSLERAIESALRADTMVYSIYFAGQEGPGGGGISGPWGGGRRGGGWPGSGDSSADGKQVLERLSRQTGGRMFEASNRQSIDQIYAQIQDELRNQYNLGYTPDRAADGGSEYRRIRVTTTRKDLKVQARESYYASRQMGAKPGQ
ncbi:MAG TPA: VWA domain-containing protein [Terriglobales bacterium]|nr:VWA domain-containing protein [Terriglobales bacterium]